MMTRRRKPAKSARRTRGKRSSAKRRTQASAKRRTLTRKKRRIDIRKTATKRARILAALRGDGPMTAAERRRIERLLPAILRIAGR